MSKKHQAEIIFLLATIGWGVTFLLIHHFCSGVSAQSFVFVRFLVAFLSLFPFLSYFLRKTNKEILSWAFVTGFFESVIFLSQVKAIQTLPVAKAAFISGLSVVFVPLLSPLISKEKFSFLNFLACLLAALGLFVLTGGFEGKVGAIQWGMGEFYALMSAVSIALVLVLVKKISHRIDLNLSFTFWETLFTLPLPLFFIHWETFPQEMLLMHWPTLLYCSLVATVFLFYVHIRYQKETSSHMASLIFSTEPVWATLIAVSFFKEKLTDTVLLGAIILLVAMFVPYAPLVRGARYSKYEGEG